MPRDGHLLAKGEKMISAHPAARQLSSWIARFVVPALANRAAEVEIAARHWVEDGSPRRREVAARMAAQPLGALAATAGTIYLLAVITRRRRG